MKASQILGIVLLVSAVAIVSSCLFASSSDAEYAPYGESPAFGEPGFMEPPRINEGGRGPEGMPPEDRYVVFEVPERHSHQPEDVLLDYGFIFEEKKRLDEQGMPMIVVDPQLGEDAGKELAGIITDMLGDRMTPAAPGPSAVADRITVEPMVNEEFLQAVLEHTEKGSPLERLVLMLLQTLGSESAERDLTAPSDRNQFAVRVDVIQPSEDSEEDDASEFIGSLHIPAPYSLVFIAEHRFDGGTAF